MIAYLKYLRIAIGLLFLCVLTLAFLGISTPFLHAATWFQFIPSLLKFLITLTAAGFLIIILLTFLVGRVYCSFICPLGILQDIIARIGRFFRKRKIYRYSKPLNYLRNGVLVATVVSLFSGSILALVLLDPYSMYGKITTGLFRPAFVLINDNLSKLLENLHIFITPIGIKNFSLIALVWGIVLLVVLVLFSYQRGRLYCNTICPVGTLLGWISRLTIFKIRMLPNNCTRCGKCSSVCKSECIDIRQQKIDFDRCVGCYNCLTACNENALSLQPARIIKQVATTDITNNDSSRRSFLGVLVTGIVGTGVVASIKAQTHDSDHKNSIPVHKKHTVTPPGSISLEHFTAHCTACQLCVSQCPTHVLKPSIKEYGLNGFLMPYMSYAGSFCNYECTVCTEVCPTGALLPLTVEQKKTLQIGKVNFIKENCIVYTSETSCGACAEHCPTAAVHMVPYKGFLRIPDTEQNICIGCGACEYACPATPHKAIYVEGNPVHLQAQKPQEKQQNNEAPTDFPF
ncbi:MAG TPA: 4Fe-4S binding protein [Bacteroidales bacterium]|nr:4Fe-4S binding protein [Bacteroidales bacterium]HOK99673.1 4Fe-4S binding protein [Bacteroidales bacterium]HPO65734.1 4Fe-4S binding protein [Bacteroidales bacterium]